MAYKSKTILEIIKAIEDSKVYLPALQRKFVWNKSKIELLFDSLMRNYPIGTFLFWNLKRETANSYVFYEFLKAYDQRHPFNIRKIGSFLNPEIVGVLDGQQRLSSMYIGLQGTHTEKAPYKHHSNENAFRKTSLYLNVLSLPYFIADSGIQVREDQNFEFLFLTETEASNWISKSVKDIDEEGLEISREDTMYWFKIGEILSWNDDPEFDIVIDGFIEKSSDEKQKNEIISKRRLIRKSLETLHKRIVNEQLINYFEVSKEDLEDILKIFVRVNSGGVPLSKTDLLFSTIVATWSDGRQEIESLLQRINRKGDGFSFTNEFLMRCCLVLTDTSVLFKVNSFKSENVIKIKSEWFNIAIAVEKTVDLLVEFGFNGSLLTSQNAIIIISYHILKGGSLDTESKYSIKRYLIHALLNGIYGNSQDQLLTALRNFIREQIVSENGSFRYQLKNKSFSFEDLLKIELPSRKSLYITEKEVDDFLNYKKGSSSFFVLSLLYPNLKYKEVQFHQDHIHPASKFSDSIFETFGLSKEQREEWIRLRDTIPNLQLMEGRQNESKNASNFVDWLSEKDISEQQYFKVSNYIPSEENLDFVNFKNFYQNRRSLLKSELKKVLAINNSIETIEEEYLGFDSIRVEE